MVGITTGLLALAGCAVDGGDPRPSALVITVEGVHAELLGPWGGERLPAVDALAEQSARWDRAYAVSTVGAANLASLWTGLPPVKHGLRDEGGAVLPAAVRTLAEVVGTAGWRSAAFTGGPSSAGGLGLEQGFGSWSSAGGAWSQPSGRRDADAVVQEALEALPELAGGGGPVLLWVSLGDAVWPQQEGCAGADGTRGDALRCMDQAIGRLVRAWDQVRPEGVVVLTADQGGGPGDGGEAMGLVLDDAALRVPLLVRGGGMRAGAVYTHPVSLEALPRTLLKVFRVGEELPGVDLRHDAHHPVAEALAPARLGLAPLRALTLAEGRVVRGEWGAWYPASEGGIALEPAEDPAAAEHGRALDAWIQAHPPVLSRRRPLGLHQGRQRGALALTGVAAEERLGEDPRGHPALPLAVQAQRALALGRLAAAQRAVRALIEEVPDAEGPWALQARVLLERGHLADARGLLVALDRACPGPGLALVMADVAAGVGDWPVALTLYQEVLVYEPLHAGALLGQVRSLRALGHEDEARAWAASSAPLQPVSVDQWLLWAALGLLTLDPRLAVEAADQALALEPGHPLALWLGAEGLLALGQEGRALEALRQAQAQAPEDLPLRRDLGALLLDRGEGTEALRVLAPAVVRERDPEAAALYAQALELVDAAAAAGP